MVNENRNKMIDCLVESYRTKLMGLSNMAIAEDAFNNMKCAYCPCRNYNCDLYTCVKTVCDFIEEK